MNDHQRVVLSGFWIVWMAACADPDPFPKTDIGSVTKTDDGCVTETDDGSVTKTDDECVTTLLFSGAACEPLSADRVHLVADFNTPDAERQECLLDTCNENDACLTTDVVSDDGTCAHVFCDGGGVLCPTRLPASRDGRVMVLDALLPVGDGSFAGLKLPLVGERPDTFEVHEDECLIFSAAVDVPPPGRVEIALYETPYDADGAAAESAETSPKVRLSDYSARGHGWCRIRIPVKDLIQQGGLTNGESRPLDPKRIGAIHFVLALPESPGLMVESISGLLRVDDVGFGACEADSDVCACPPP